MSDYRKPRDVRRQIIGKRNKLNGGIFEDKIMGGCCIYAANQIALIQKTPEPMRPLRPLGKGQFVACFEKKAQPDFKGVLYGGKAIEFEAKFTETGRIHKDAVSKEQAEHLTLMSMLGAVCFVLVCFSFNTYARIPWTVWENMKQEYGRLYITEQEAKKYAVHFKNFALDFLRGINS